jgi:hypothetical protein
MLSALMGRWHLGKTQRPKLYNILEEVRLSIHSPQVVVRTLLLAVLKAAPENLRENLLRAIGSGIKDQLTSLDFGSVSWFKYKWHPHHRQTLMHMLHMSLLTKTVSGLFMIGAI